MLEFFIRFIFTMTDLLPGEFKQDPVMMGWAKIGSALIMGGFYLLTLCLVLSVVTPVFFTRRKQAIILSALAINVILTVLFVILPMGQQ